MCKKAPGPRCASHLNADLRSSLEALRSARRSGEPAPAGEEERYNQLKREYDATEEGQNKLQDLRDEAVQEGWGSVEGIDRRIQAGQYLRDQKMRAYNRAVFRNPEKYLPPDDVPSPVRAHVFRNMERNNYIMVPREKHEQNFLSYSDSLKVQRVLAESPTVNASALRRVYANSQGLADVEFAGNYNTPRSILSKIYAKVQDPDCYEGTVMQNDSQRDRERVFQGLAVNKNTDPKHLEEMVDNPMLSDYVRSSVASNPSANKATLEKSFARLQKMQDKPEDLANPWSKGSTPKYRLMENLAMNPKTPASIRDEFLKDENTHTSLALNRKPRQKDVSVLVRSSDPLVRANVFRRGKFSDNNFEKAYSSAFDSRNDNWDEAKELLRNPSLTTSQFTATYNAMKTNGQGHVAKLFAIRNPVANSQQLREALLDNIKPDYMMRILEHPHVSRDVTELALKLAQERNISDRLVRKAQEMLTRLNKN